MGFEPASQFMFLAAKKYNLDKQVSASITCERVSQLFDQFFPNFCDFWVPQKIERGVLTIKAKNSAASSELFMQTHVILDRLTSLNCPDKVKEIRIVRR